MEILTGWGYWGLFLSSFLAATILPFSSEAVLGYLLIHGFSPLLLNKVLGISDFEMVKAETRFKKYGIFSLLFAWVPIVGDPLTVAAGILKINFVLFLVLVGLGKFLRYVVVSWAVLSI